MPVLFEPFTPDEFHRQTGLIASDNEAIYIRWVNTQINYANYQTMREMVASLKEIRSILKDSQQTEQEKFPFVK